MFFSYCKLDCTWFTSCSY